jgi:hypothetical protein
MGVETLVYSYGRYRHSLAITIATNIPRTALYFILVPIYGMDGATLSYTVGSLAGLGISIFVAERIPMKLMWKHLLILLIPLLINFVLPKGKTIR